MFLLLCMRSLCFWQGAAILLRSRVVVAYTHGFCLLVFSWCGLSAEKWRKEAGFVCTSR